MTNTLFFSGLLLLTTIVLCIMEYRFNKRSMREMRANHEREILKYK